MNQDKGKGWILILILIVLAIPLVFKIWEEVSYREKDHYLAPAAVRYEPEEFRFGEDDSVLTVLVGPGTYHRIWANKPFVMLSGQQEGGHRPYPMPAGWSSAVGHEPEGLLRLKGLHDGTIVKFQKVK